MTDVLGVKRPFGSPELLYEAGAALLRGDAFFRTVFDALPAAIYTTDADGHITYYNEAAAVLWGNRPELGRSEWCGSWKLYRPDGTPLPHNQCPMALALKERRPVRGMEAVAERPDGIRVPFIPYPTPLYDASGQLIGAVNMLVDITDRKRTEITLAKRVDEQAALVQFTDRLQRAASLDDVYESGLDSILHALRCERASILLFDDSRVMRFVAWRGLSESYRQAVDGHSPWAYDATDPQPICVDDITKADISDDLKAIVKREGIGAFAFIPLVESGSLVGKFMAYYDAPHVFTEGEVELALTIARQLGFGVQRIRAEDSKRRAEEQLRAREAELERVIDLTPFMLTRCSSDLRYRFVSQAYARMIGRRPEDFTGRPIVEIMGDEGFNTILPHVQKVLQGTRVEYESRIPFRGSGDRFLRVEYTPERNEQGNVIGWIASILDISQRKSAEEYARQLALFVESSDDAIITIDLGRNITSWNLGAARVFGYTAEEAIGKPIYLLVPHDRQNEESVILDRIRRGEHVNHYETVRRRKDGTALDISLTVSPIRNSEGTIIGASKIARDITERRRAQEQQALLVNEIKHRIKNTLATVQAIATQTLRSAPSAERQVFLSRLQALAGAHDLLTSENWRQTSMKEVVHRILKPFQAHREGRFILDGPDGVWVDAHKASVLAMALHELATNAIKYGALSNESGQIHLVWEQIAQESLIRLSWKEIGGPPVEQPMQRGFGSRLIERAFDNGLGRAQLDFDSRGLKCELEIST